MKLKNFRMTLWIRIEVNGNPRVLRVFDTTHCKWKVIVEWRYAGLILAGFSSDFLPLPHVLCTRSSIRGTKTAVFPTFDRRYCPFSVSMDFTEAATLHRVKIYSHNLQKFEVKKRDLLISKWKRWSESAAIKITDPSFCQQAL